SSMNGLPRLGNMSSLAEIVQQQKAQRIIVAVDDRRGKLPIEDLLALKKQGAEISEGLELFESITGKIPLESLRLSWLLFGPGFRLSRGMVLYKRTFSIVLGLPAFLLSLPIVVLAGIAIRLESKGAAIFSQMRIGKDGVPFRLYKLRTLYENSD